MQPESTIEQRLARLEGQNRRLRVLSLGGFVLATLAMAAPFAAHAAPSTTYLGDVFADHVFAREVTVGRTAEHTGLVVLRADGQTATVSVVGSGDDAQMSSLTPGSFTIYSSQPGAQAVWSAP